MSFLWFVSASDISQLDDLDELEVYGDQPVTKMDSQITQYNFEVRVCLYQVFIKADYGNKYHEDWLLRCLFMLRFC